MAKLLNTKMILVFVLFFSVLACNNEPQKQTDKSGLEYTLFSGNTDAVKPAIGDYLILDMVFKTAKDSILFNSKEIGGQFKLKLTAPSHDGGSIENALSMLAVGDSIDCQVDGKNFFEKTRQMEVPEFLSEGEKITFHIKLVDFQTKEDFTSELDKLEIEKMNVEKASLQDYLKAENITAEPTAEGMYYIELQAGTGEQATAGKTVSVHYTGMFLDGRVFDSSVKRNEPFEFVLGAGRVIQGWDLGVAKMKIGDKVRLILPSDLAYGASGAGGVIPPFTTLVFDVELLAIK